MKNTEIQEGLPAQGLPAEGQNLPDAISSELKKAIPEIQAYRSAAELTIPLREIKIEGVDDREGYNSVDEARKNVRAERLELQKTGKATVEYLEAAKKIVRNQVTEIRDIYAETEETLKAKLAAIDDEKTRIKEAEERAALELFNNRVEQLFTAGFKYDGLNYIAGSLAITPQDIQDSADELFHDFVTQGREFVAEQQRLEAERQAELERFREMERRQKEEQERLEKEAARLEAQRIAQEQAEKERVAREAEFKRLAEKAQIAADLKAKENAEKAAAEEKERIYRETSQKAQAETTRQIQAEIDAKQAALEEQQRQTVQDLEQKGRADGRAAVGQSTATANQIEELPAGYVAGFNAFRNLMIEAFESGEKRTRVQWIEFIRDLEVNA